MTLQFPQDILDGSYSTAFASKVTPDEIVIPVRSSPQNAESLESTLNLHNNSKSTLRREFQIWESTPEIVVHRQTRWKISHMPSLQSISAKEYMIVSKSELDHQKIIAVFFDKMTHIETRRLEIGDNERQYPTDCVSAISQSGDLLYVALNKRTKSSEPFSVELHAYDLTSNLEIGYFCKQGTTCRFVSSLQN